MFWRIVTDRLRDKFERAHENLRQILAPGGRSSVAYRSAGGLGRANCLGSALWLADRFGHCRHGVVITFGGWVPLLRWECTPRLKGEARTQVWRLSFALGDLDHIRVEQLTRLSIILRSLEPP